MSVEPRATNTPGRGDPKPTTDLDFWELNLREKKTEGGEPWRPAKERRESGAPARQSPVRLVDVIIHVGSVCVVARFCFEYRRLQNKLYIGNNASVITKAERRSSKSSNKNSSTVYKIIL
ncbi:unnamed protein product [Bursaphelenchus okinawaensis]|uniref:Uncharacterized protein n=1 Tax=Bursaphelenchus okinawaensis TaxID=465554 RepID=A0A811L5U1_9BILA|nr:unnamed protein product [Bursaphelenchus okinawaensis]CAG9118010.1 unnamed protein product [Bursaphelenchus okinawaensis]